MTMKIGIKTKFGTTNSEIVVPSSTDRQTDCHAPRKWAPTPKMTQKSKLSDKAENRYTY